MAAHLEGKGASVLDFTGFAQKFGPVLSFVRLGPTPDAINQVRIDPGSADAVIACDVVVSSSPKASACYRRGTRVVLNLAEMPTGDVVRHRDADLAVERAEGRDRRRRRRARTSPPSTPTALAENAARRQRLRQHDDARLRLAARPGPGLLRGALRARSSSTASRAKGTTPPSPAAALLAAKPEALVPASAPRRRRAETLDTLIDRRAAFLADYQDAAYADRYRRRLAASPRRAAGRPRPRP